MKSSGTPLHGTYFELLEAKHPDLALAEGLANSRQAAMGRRRRPLAPALMLLGVMGGVSWLAVSLRPDRPAPVRPPQQIVGDARPKDLAEPSYSSAIRQPEPKAVVATVPAIEIPESLERSRTTPTPASAMLAAVKSRTSDAEAGPTPEPWSGIYELATLAAEAPTVEVVEPLAWEQPRSTPEANGTSLVESNDDPTSGPTASSEELERAGLAARPASPRTASTEPPQRAEAPPVTAQLGQPLVPTPLEVGGIVKPPRRLVTSLPPYPDEAWARGVTGDVLVRAVIDERGKVADVEVLRGLPYGMTEAAVAAIERWRFAPATRHGEAVAVYRNLSVRFES